MIAILDTFLLALTYFVSCFVLFFLGKLAYQLVNKYVHIKYELVEKDNFAFAVAHTGYLAGLLLAIGGAIIGPSHGIVNDLIDIFTYGLLAIVLLNLSILINQKLILRKFSIYKEIFQDQNTGTGVIEAANGITTGLIILGAVYGEGGDWITAVVFWIIGQCLLVVTALVYQWITPYNDQEEIERDNVAAGLGMAGAMVAIGNLIRNAIMHDFVSWEDSLIRIAINFCLGIILLPVMRFLASKVLLHGHSITQEVLQEKPNNGVGLIEAFAYIGGSILITWCF